MKSVRSGARHERHLVLVKTNTVVYGSSLCGETHLRLFFPEVNAIGVEVIGLTFSVVRIKSQVGAPYCLQPPHLKESGMV